MACVGTGSALADDCSGHDHTAGTVLGAAGGAAVGGSVSHNAGGAIAGAVVGGLAGNAIARSEDCGRRQDYDQRSRGYQQGHYQPAYGGPDENDYWGVESYEDFNNDYQHIWAEIQRGKEDGTLSRRDAHRYADQLQKIRARADWQQRSGRFDPEDIEARLGQLRRTVHFARRDGGNDPYRH